MECLKYGTGSKRVLVVNTSRISLFPIPGVKELSTSSHPPVMPASLQFSFFF